MPIPNPIPKSVPKTMFIPKPIPKWMPYYDINKFNCKFNVAEFPIPPNSGISHF